MALNIIYGRSGSGKSKYLYDDITSKIGAEKIYLIVPEQSNLSAEKRLFDVSQKDSLIDVEVLTLSRMAHRVNSAILQKRPILSKSAKNIIIYDILSKNKNSLNFLGKSDKNIEIVERLFTELKKHKITNEQLSSVETEDTYLNYKLDDIRLLFKSYEEKIENTYIDENDELTLLAENFDETDEFNDAVFYVDEFLGFTPQEYMVFEKILEKAKDVYVAISLDSLENNSSIENDIFYFNRIYAKELIKIANEKGVKVNNVYLDNIHKYQNKELLFLEKNLFKYNVKYDFDVNNIKLFLANNPYSELEYVGATIYQLVKEGYRYNEIGVISENLEEYAEDAKSIFKNYGIPIFIDEKKTLSQNLLIRFIFALLEIFSQNWTYDSVMNYVKMGLLDIDNEDIYELENYCLKWGITRSKWYNKKFAYEEANDKQEKIESLRKKIVEPLIRFRNNVSNNRTATELSKDIYNFLIENNICQELDKKLKDYNNIEVADEYNTSYKMLISILEEISTIFKDEKITFEKYRDLFKAGVESCEIGKIPATQDQVIFGDTERTRSGKLRVVFVIGVNDGYFPFTNTSEGFFNDTDRQILKDHNFVLAKDSIDSLYEEQFNIYRTLLAPEEKLYLTYSSSDKNGGVIRPSVLIKKINNLFSNKIKVESDIIEKIPQITNYNKTFEEALNAYRDFISGKEITEEWKEVIAYYQKYEIEKFTSAMAGISYTNRAEKITKEHIKKLYGNNLETTISRLENYRRCPFSFHMTYGLKLKERNNLKIESVDTGNFMHEVIDLFFKSIDEQNINIKEMEDEDVYRIVSSIINELLDTSRYYKFTSTAKFRLLTRRLKKVIYNTICYIVYSLKYSDFSVLGHEVEFSNNGRFKKLELDVDDKKVRITGKIDRVDVGQYGEKQYVRIIDYKSSKKSIDMKQVESGLQIQLITYLDAICEETGHEPSGLFYLGMVYDSIKDSKSMTEEEIKSNLRKNFRMNGIVLADTNIIKMMDKNLQNGEKSDIIPVALNKTGEIAKNNGVAINKEEFQKLQEQVKEIIKEISREIWNGRINIKPYKYGQRSGCDYCQYKSICMFNTGLRGNEYNIIN